MRFDDDRVRNGERKKDNTENRRECVSARFGLNVFDNPCSADIRVVGTSPVGGLAPG